MLSQYESAINFITKFCINPTENQSNYPMIPSFCHKIEAIPVFISCGFSFEYVLIYPPIFYKSFIHAPYSS